MRRPTSIWAVLGLLLPATAGAAWIGDVEAGVVFAGYNDVRVPGAGGSDFSLTSDLEADPALYYRIRFGYDIGKRHEVSLLFAPLTVTSEGRFNRPIEFNGVTLPADEVVTATYRFDSYRATYRYNFGPWGRNRLGVGGTVKVRDAGIDLRAGTRAAEKTNTGVVPLVNFKWELALSRGWAVFGEGDALAAPQGRAEDVAVGVAVRPNDRVAIKALYRILEGGADNDEVYNFALFHYAGAVIRMVL